MPPFERYQNASTLSHYSNDTNESPTSVAAFDKSKISHGPSTTKTQAATMSREPSSTSTNSFQFNTIFQPIIPNQNKTAEDTSNTLEVLDSFFANMCVCQSSEAMQRLRNKRPQYTKSTKTDATRHNLHRRSSSFHNLKRKIYHPVARYPSLGPAPTSRTSSPSPRTTVPNRLRVHQFMFKPLSHE